MDTFSLADETVVLYLNEDASKIYPHNENIVSKTFHDLKLFVRFQKRITEFMNMPRIIKFIIALCLNNLKQINKLLKHYYKIGNHPVNGVKKNVLLRTSKATWKSPYVIV